VPLATPLAPGRRWIRSGRPLRPSRRPPAAQQQQRHRDADCGRDRQTPGLVNCPAHRVASICWHQAAHGFRAMQQRSPSISTAPGAAGHRCPVGFQALLTSLVIGAAIHDLQARQFAPQGGWWPRKRQRNGQNGATAVIDESASGLGHGGHGFKFEWLKSRLRWPSPGPPHDIHEALAEAQALIRHSPSGLHRLSSFHPPPVRPPQAPEPL